MRVLDGKAGVARGVIMHSDELDAVSKRITPKHLSTRHRFFYIFVFLMSDSDLV